MGARREILGVVIAAVLTFSMTGCQALMEQTEVDQAKTVGISTYEGFENIYEEGTDEQILAGGGIICNMSKVIKGEDNFETFMKRVNEGNLSFIRIKQKIGETDTYFRDLFFDGSKYRMIISLNPEKYDYTYDYLYDLSGRRNKNCRKSRIVVLSNKKDVKFEDVIENIGANDKNQDSDYQLVFRNQ